MRRNRKDVELEISMEEAEKLYNDLLKISGGEFAGFVFEGSLLDEYAVVMTGNQVWKIHLSKGRPILARKYVYIEEKHVDCWTSKNVLVLTDDKSRFEGFLKSRFVNKSDFEDFCYESGLEKIKKW